MKARTSGGLMKQSTSHILLIRPAAPGYNRETASSNVFQQPADADEESVRQQVQVEFDAFASTLRAAGVDVIVIDDTPSPQKPDAVFPNNWVSFHSDGRAIL
ncbi:MAG: amidinotransferase, partial [Cyclobacteriaceae bacterium]|nr:amidinotransferase [Cyclobacteriaceae bacterium]